jgi:hypothetical protein
MRAPQGLDEAGVEWDAHATHVESAWRVLEQLDAVGLELCQEDTRVVNKALDTVQDSEDLLGSRQARARPPAGPALETPVRAGTGTGPRFGHRVFKSAATGWAISADPQQARGGKIPVQGGPWCSTRLPARLTKKQTAVGCDVRRSLRSCLRAAMSGGHHGLVYV